MCARTTECAVGSACVAGRCQREGATPAISAARRIVLEPAAVAFLRRGERCCGGALPPFFTLGRRGGDSILLVRFEAPLPPDASIVEAYLLLDREGAVDSDPTPIALHAARVVDAWDPRDVSWALQPRIEEVQSPSTIVPIARPIVRIDVRSLVQRWRVHDPRDQGIAVVAEMSSTTGVSFVLTPASDSPDSDSASKLGAGPELSSVSGGKAPPRLELYLK